MEANGLFSGMLGLEMPLHQNPQNPPNPQNPHNPMHQPQMVPYAPHHDPDPHQNPHQSVKQGYPFAPKSKQIALSDDDEPGFGADDKRKISPWQRMKWTDTMVRLLIMAVFYIGDEASDGPDPAGKKKPAGGLLQKKGKWKSVSRAMMEKGFYVSPQQCEDKFNDLNKRYKRVNDILGKGTACRVVENQGLLEKMDLAPKMKEEVRKLLNSKHLFFREMCAYHNSCGHGTVGGASNGAHNSPPEAATEPSEIPAQQQQQQRCFHSSENAQAVANSGRSETEGSKMVVGGSGGEDEDEDEEEDESEDEDDEEEDEVIGGGCRGQNGHGNHEDEDDNNDERAPRKMARKEGCSAGSSSSSQLMQQLSCEMRVVMQDVTKTPWEKQQWLKTRLIQLEEQQVSYQYQAFELEKQRLKWIKYSGKKERDMERAKLENERRRLENERMLLLVRRKELELHQQQQQQQQQQNSSNKRSDPSSLTG